MKISSVSSNKNKSEDLTNTDKGYLVVIFGESDITLPPAPDSRLCVKVNSVDFFKPHAGEVICDGADGIDCWFIDTDYNEESFFVRHAYSSARTTPTAL